MPDPTNKMKADPPWTCAGCGREQGGPSGYGHRGVNEIIACLTARIGTLRGEVAKLTETNAALEREVAPYRQIRADVAEALTKYPDRARGKKGVAVD